MAPSAGNKKVANSLVTLSSAAILVVYAAGFMKTRAAAAKLDDASNERRPSMPAPATAGETRTPPQIEPTTDTAKATDLKSPTMPKPETTTAAAPGAPGAPVAPAATKSAAAPVAPKAPVAPNLTNPANPTNQSGSPEQNPTNGSNPTNLPVAAAVAVAEAAKPAEEKLPSSLLMPKEKYKDGTYLGWGTCRHGDIQASVTVESGRITSTSIAQCWTRYSCSWVAHLPGQVVTRQSPDVDYVSGATQSANAFYWAVIDALNKAKGPQVRTPEQK